MFEGNFPRILAQIKPEDVVLDIGGWFNPFFRANWVIDVLPYATRGRPVGGQAKEYYSHPTWIQRDICSREPLPFKDKEIDFLVCSHTLEDIRDPIFLCAEICRVAKRGYIELPSQIAELSLGIGCRRIIGYPHHRWIAQISNNKITFLLKPHFLHTRWKYHFPYSYTKRLKLHEQERLQWLFWEGSFDFEEKIIVGYEEFLHEIEEFIRSKQAYPEYRYQMEKLRDLAKKTRDSFFKIR